MTDKDALEALESSLVQASLENVPDQAETVLNCLHDQGYELVKMKPWQAMEAMDEAFARRHIKRQEEQLAAKDAEIERLKGEYEQVTWAKKVEGDWIFADYGDQPVRSAR
jgi:hypothetical protein